MDILPILSTLRRHKLTSWLLILEIALTCAIVCNAVFLIGQRLQRMDMPSGVAEHELLQIQVADVTAPSNPYARMAEDVAVLRQVPGVISVASSNQVPFGTSSSNGNIRLDPAQPERTLFATTYFGENLVQTLGTRLVSGRDLKSDDFVDVETAMKGLGNGDSKSLPHVTLITQTLAERLWPGQNPLGRVIYLTPVVGLRVVGVVDSLVRPNAYDKAKAQYTMVVPIRMGANKDQSYLIRTRPEDRASVMAAALVALKKADPQRVVTTKRSFDEVRRKFFQDDRAMAGMLVGVIAALLIVTALGIVGLASFWVAQRRRTIGVRRALGATRRNILNYFQTENFLLATIGIALGMLLAYGINLFLMLHYELPRLPAVYFPVGAISLWLIGQLAVLGPALRAAAVPPVVATRSV
ncbi:FtsX-like permease family protein [Rhodanobacter glycinis]|uniref:FtsX-like permease family protein n=1 Tax=Rhodanobacter glycinis TaxID=582702 RepID=A0A502C9P0_9GAMM|nr:FtsX-like permease family protein [Rhodanobacter glycinis]TPG08719.1 FtsX-like permease family protein [Rhodanobacter glycinis]